MAFWIYAGVLLDREGRVLAGDWEIPGVLRLAGTLTFAGLIGVMVGAGAVPGDLFGVGFGFALGRFCLVYFLFWVPFVGFGVLPSGSVFWI
jgi:hypothetical protein